ncbi:MAG: adenine phosphoribosyltransferase [Hellea sp.]|nr:adenine phosphoribosyltransferase [Hellea sp.]
MNLKDTIRTIPDFPKKGIMFRDVTTLMTSRRGFAESIIQLSAPFQDIMLDNIVGIEARGFVFGAAVAYELGAGFVPIRKKGKLPFDTYEEAYDLEYGHDVLEMHADAVRRGEKILVVDDLLATGGTAVAAIKILQKAGAKVVAAAFVVELPELGGRKRLEGMGIEVQSLVEFDGQ